jgi:hypothetical protein
MLCRASPIKLNEKSREKQKHFTQRRKARKGTKADVLSESLRLGAFA